MIRPGFIVWLFASVLLLSGGLWQTARGEDPPPAAPLDAVAMRQNEFSIPFRLPPAADPAQQPLEIQLHVSADHGVTWQVASRVKPAAGRFVFRAPHDGEYWFCTRTVDRQGTTRPDGAQKPELKVVVDTMPPRLDLTATRGPAGEITARWQVVDPNLKPESLTLEYQPGPNEPWQKLAIDPPPATARYTMTGETTWWPKAAEGPITVRAQVTDRAENPTVKLTLVAAAPDKDAAPVAGRPGADNGPSAPRGPSDSGTPGSTAAGSDSGAPRVSPPQPGTSTGGSGRVNWPAEPNSPDRSPLSNTSGSGSASSDPFTSRPPGRTTSSAYGPAATPVSSRPGSGALAAAEEPPPGAGGILRMDLLPPGERPRMINSRRFELEYDVESVGPSGIAKVELWGTVDGGRSWSSFGVDNDNRSPLLVNVPTAGLYGFTVIFTNGNGFGGYAPREGDLPEIWVGVDLTPPTARITGAEMGRDAGELLVHWEAEDDLLDPRPVALSFAERPTGPWSTIAAGLENTGQYAWRLDNRVPDRIYLRIEVRDEAGNIGSYISPDPVAVDLQRPQGHIRGVHPVTPPQGSRM